MRLIFDIWSGNFQINIWICWDVDTTWGGDDLSWPSSVAWGGEGGQGAMSPPPNWIFGGPKYHLPPQTKYEVKSTYIIWKYIKELLFGNSIFQCWNRWWIVKMYNIFSPCERVLNIGHESGFTGFSTDCNFVPSTIN